MADSKITALTALTAADPVNDMFPVVDVSDTSMAASGTTKRISANNILSSSPTASGALTVTGLVTAGSASITGDLTVDTSTLKVDSTNDVVLIGSATKATYGANKLEVRGASISDASLGGNNTGNLAILTTDSQAIDTGGVLSLGGGFNGTTPYMFAGIAGRKETATNAIAQGYLQLFTTNVSNGITERYRITGDGVHTWRNVGGVAGTAMTLNSTGLGIGVTPSAWNSGYKAVELASNVGAWSATTGINDFSLNSFFNASSQWIYKTTATAALYRQQTGQHIWYNAPSGTAGNTITFTQAMTLDASGNLLVGTTSQNGSWNTKLTISNDSGTTKWAVGPYLGGVTNFLISAGASAGVYLNGTAATSWTSASDERLKDIIEPISNAVSKVASLRAVIGKFKFDENNTRKPFLIAQDIQAVLPEAVDASNPDKLGVAYTDVIPLLVAAIKELTARVQTLEAR